MSHFLTFSEINNTSTLKGKCILNNVDLLLLNLSEVKRGSVKVWMAIPEDKLDWKPDAEALNCKEMIRHVLAAEYGYLQILENQGSVQNPSYPFETRPFTSVQDE